MTPEPKPTHEEIANSLCPFRYQHRPRNSSNSCEFEMLCNHCAPIKDKLDQLAQEKAAEITLLVKRIEAMERVVEATNSLKFWCMHSHGHQPDGYKEFCEALTLYNQSTGRKSHEA